MIIETTLVDSGHKPSYPAMRDGIARAKAANAKWKTGDKVRQQEDVRKIVPGRSAAGRPSATPDDSRELRDSVEEREGA